VGWSPLLLSPEEITALWAVGSLWAALFWTLEAVGPSKFDIARNIQIED